MSDITPKISLRSNHYCLVSYKIFRESRDNSVGIATACWTTEDSMFDTDAKVFLFFITSRQALGTVQPPRQWTPRNLSQGIKLLKRETHHSNSKIKSDGAILPFPHKSLWCGT
jgi:hypothetical protein